MRCLNREQFVIVGWTDLTGSRSHIGALLLGYNTEDGRLDYAGRAGTGMTEKELKRLAGVLAPLQAKRMPLAEPPPRDRRFGSPLELARVHWVRPEVVVEVTYLTWTEDNLPRPVSYQGQREDEPASQVVREVPHPPRPGRQPVGRAAYRPRPIPDNAEPTVNAIKAQMVLRARGAFQPPFCRNFPRKSALPLQAQSVAARSVPL